MGVKYVKDFAYDSGFGFTGSSGKNPVKAHMRKAPGLAPAMVEKTSPKMGGKASETKNLAAYNKPHMEGKKGPSAQPYAKGGEVAKFVRGGPTSRRYPGQGGKPYNPYTDMRIPIPYIDDEVYKQRNRIFKDGGEVSNSKKPSGRKMHKGPVKEGKVAKYAKGGKVAKLAGGGPPYNLPGMGPEVNKYYNEARLGIGSRGQIIPSTHSEAINAIDAALAKGIRGAPELVKYAAQQALSKGRIQGGLLGAGAVGAAAYGPDIMNYLQSLMGRAKPTVTVEEIPQTPQGRARGGRMGKRK